MQYGKKVSFSTKTKIILSLLILIFIRIGSNIPMPFINRDLIKGITENLSLVNIFSGGSLEKMSLFALGVSPYITASIILQLLTVVFKRLKEVQEREHEKYEKILFISNIIFSLLISFSTAIAFGKSGYFHFTVIKTSIITLLFTLGSVLIVILSLLIDKIWNHKTNKNGISIVLAAGIIATLPSNLFSAIKVLCSGKKLAFISLIIVIMLIVIIGIIVFSIILNNSNKQIPITHSQKNGGKSSLPIPINPAGVIPVIFTSQIFSVILMLFHNSWTKYFSQNNWFDLQVFKYTIGFIPYAILTILFAYFYTSISFNVYQIADNLKKSGSMISGIRPGKPTIDYLNNILRPIIFKGAIGLLIIQVIPMIISGIWGIDVSFGGTSILIVVGVILDVYKRFTAQKKSSYKVNRLIY